MLNDKPLAASEPKVEDLMQALQDSMDRARKARAMKIGDEDWLRAKFPEKDWHRHARGMSGETQMCDGTPSDCASKARL